MYTTTVYLTSCHFSSCKITFVRESRKIASEIKVIFMTAIEIEKGRIKKIETAELLKKPIGLHNLVTIVNKVLGKIIYLSCPMRALTQRKY